MWWRRLRYILALVALCSIATCPAAKRACTAHNRAREADELLETLGDRIADHVATTGRVPPTAAPRTPQPSCCERGGTCSDDPETWSAPGWRELAFSIDGTYRYSYEYVPDPSGAAAIVRAVGDLDCDGTSSLYELKLTVHGTAVDRMWTRRDPYE